MTRQRKDLRPAGPQLAIGEIRREVHPKSVDFERVPHTNAVRVALGLMKPGTCWTVKADRYGAALWRAHLNNVKRSGWYERHIASQGLTVRTTHNAVVEEFKLYLETAPVEQETPEDAAVVAAERAKDLAKLKDLVPEAANYHTAIGLLDAKRYGYLTAKEFYSIGVNPHTEILWGDGYKYVPVPEHLFDPEWTGTKERDIPLHFRWRWPVPNGLYKPA